MVQKGSERVQKGSERFQGGSERFKTFRKLRADG